VGLWDSFGLLGRKRRWDRLKAALGTTSSDFVDATLVQIQNASRMLCGGISEISVNAVLAFIEGVEPKNEMEAGLATQMACMHAVTMAVLSRAGGAYGGDRHVAMMAPPSERRYPNHSGRTDRGFRYCTSNHWQYRLTGTEMTYPNGA
jgi:hypothetical protein